MKKRVKSMEWPTDAHHASVLWKDLDRDLAQAVDKSISDLTEKLKTVIDDQKGAITEHNA